MPPKESGTKRKATAQCEGSGELDVPAADKVKQTNEQQAASDDEDDGKDNDKPAAKKAKKAAKEPVKPLDPNIPTNTTFPLDVKFEPKKSNVTRLSCWNGGPQD